MKDERRAANGRRAAQARLQPTREHEARALPERLGEDVPRPQYDRRVPPLALLTGVAYVCVAVLMTLLAVKLAPRRWGTTSVVVGVLAVGGSYIAIRAATETGFNEWLDHDVLEEIGGEVDDLSLWLIALGGAVAVLAVARLRR